MLAVFKQEIETALGEGVQVRTTLLNTFEFEKIEAEAMTEIDGFGKVLNYIVIRPDIGTDEPDSTGFAKILQDFMITGIISTGQGTENILEREFQAIRGRLRKLNRLSPTKFPCAVHLKNLRFSAIDRTRVGDTLVHFKTLLTTVQDQLRNTN